MATRATALPAHLTAGDSWTWERSFADYPADDGWVLSYGIVGDNVLAWDPAWSVADGSMFVVTIPMGKTAQLAKGGSTVFAEVLTKGAERVTFATQTRIVAADPMQFAPGDGISWARRMVRTIEAFLEGHLEDGLQYTMIGTRQLQHIPLPELRAFLAQLRDEVKAERAGVTGILGRPIRFALKSA